MSTTQNKEIQKQYTRRFSSIEGKFESPSSKNKGEVSKISENIKLLSSEINTQYKKRASMQINENIHEKISNLFEKDAQLLALTNKQSIIHELDFLQASPTTQRKKNLKTGLRRRSTMTAQKSPALSQQRSFSLTNSENKNQSLRKLSTMNPSINFSNFSKKNSFKKVEFSIFDKSASKIINQGIIESESESESIGEIEREYLLFGFSNTKRIKKNRIRSMENNPKKLSFYEKNLFHKQKKLLEVEMLRNKIKNEKQLEYKEVPELSRKTKEIIKEKLNETKPLYQRIDEVMEGKNNYIHKLKKFHNEESKNVKWKEFNDNYENSNIKELSNIDNFEFSHIIKNPPLTNSVKNIKTNYNNKFLNSTKTPESANSTFLKMLNDTNIDLLNVTSIPVVNTLYNAQKNETMDYSDNFKADEDDEQNEFGNSKFNDIGYLEFMQNRKINADKNNSKNKNEKDFSKNNKNRSAAENNNYVNKRNINHNDFEPEEYVKFDIAYPERTLNWAKKKDIWLESKNKKLNYNRERSEKAENDLLRTLFKPKTNKNSERIVSTKKMLSRSMNMSQNDFNNYNNNNNENLNNYSNYNNEEIILNESNNNYNNDNYNNNQSMYNKSRLNSQEQTVFENLYSRRFEGEEKRKQILEEMTSDFKPKTNSDYRVNANASSSFLGESLKNSSSKFNNIPLAPKKKVFAKNKNENFVEFDEGAENKSNVYIREERREKFLEIQRQREEMRIKRFQGKEEESKAKKHKRTLMDLLDEVEKENEKNRRDENTGKRRKSETTHLYKLNIRSASAWDHNKENSVYFDRKFAKILSKAGMIKY